MSFNNYEHKLKIGTNCDRIKGFKFQKDLQKTRFSIVQVISNKIYVLFIHVTKKEQPITIDL